MRLLSSLLLARDTQGGGEILYGQPGSPSQCLSAGMWVSSQSCSINASSSCSSKHSSFPWEVPCTEQQCQQPGERSQGRALQINVQGGQLWKPNLLLGAGRAQGLFFFLAGEKKSICFQFSISHSGWLQETRALLPVTPQLLQQLQSAEPPCLCHPPLPQNEAEQGK